MNVKLYARCGTCGVVHPCQVRQEALDFAENHRGHDVAIIKGYRNGLVRWLFRVVRNFALGVGLQSELLLCRGNADVKIAYASSAALTITLASLATSASMVAGRESTAVDNTSNKYLTYLLAGIITTGTSPTDVKEIRVYVYGSYNDTPLYPDTIDGTDSAETMTSAGVRDSGLKIAAVIATTSTSDVTYPFGPIDVASLFGGVMPKHWGVWVTHNTGVNLNATGSNHAIYQTGVYETVV